MIDNGNTTGNGRPCPQAATRDIFASGFLLLVAQPAKKCRLRVRRFGSLGHRGSGSSSHNGSTIVRKLIIAFGLRSLLTTEALSRRPCCRTMIDREIKYWAKHL